MSFREQQPPANTGTGTIEADPAAALFNAEYVFGTRTYAIDQDPGPSAPSASGSTIAPEDPIDVTTPADQEPTPAAMGGPNVGSDSIWVLWPSGVSTIVVKLPNAQGVRAVWFPVVPFPIVVSPGNAPGSLLYEVTTAGAELVPIPGVHPLIALTAISKQSTWDGLWVYVTGQDFGPSKAGGTVFPGPGAQSGYDNLIIANPTLLDYWPCSDAAGTTQLLNLGPAQHALQALNGVTLGASGFLPNNRTCAQADGSSGTGLVAPAITLNSGVQSLECWVYLLTNDALILTGNIGPPNESPNACAVFTNVENLLGYGFSFSSFETNAVCATFTAHHIVYTQNGSIPDLYLDGSLVASTGPGYGSWVGSLSLLFKADTDNQNTPAKICNIATYSGVLSLSEVREHYALGIAGS